MNLIDIQPDNQPEKIPDTTTPPFIPFRDAIRFLKDNAATIEEGAGINLIKQTNLDETHTRLDLARALRTAASLLEGVTVDNIVTV